MNLSIKSVAWLLPLALTACFHKTQQAQQEPLAPPIEATPLPAPSNAPANLPPPVISEPQTPAPAPSTAPAESTPKPAPVHHRKPAGKSTEQARSSEQTKSTEQASNGSPGVSAIGELSSGNASEYRRQTEDSMAATERSLNAITRPLSDVEQKTAAHIRDYLKEARAALASGDVDGAHTLAAKAKVLLGELTK
jgi:outer membrane biosynthesis protein TonB